MRVSLASFWNNWSFSFITKTLPPHFPSTNTSISAWYLKFLILIWCSLAQDVWCLRLPKYILGSSRACLLLHGGNLLLGNGLVYQPSNTSPSYLLSWIHTPLMLDSSSYSCFLFWTQQPWITSFFTWLTGLDTRLYVRKALIDLTWPFPRIYGNPCLLQSYGWNVFLAVFWGGYFSSKHHEATL